jgi:hypothetical protein
MVAVFRCLVLDKVVEQIKRDVPDVFVRRVEMAYHSREYYSFSIAFIIVVFKFEILDSNLPT